MARPSILAPALALLAVLGLAAVALPAGAQDTSVETETRIQVFDPGEALEPDRTTTLLTVVTYRYGQGANADEPTTVELEVLETPPWAEAAFNRTSVTFPVPSSSASSGRTDSEQVLLNVTLSPDAPAFREGTLRVRARAQENGNLASSEGTDDQAIQPAYAANLDVRHDETVTVPGGRNHRVPLAVAVDANAPTLLELSLQAKPANSQVTLPDPTPVEAGDNASTPLDVSLRMPWTRNQEGTLGLRLQPYHANASDAADDPRTVEMNLVGRSLVPGPGPAGAALAAVLAAAAARRRR